MIIVPFPELRLNTEFVRFLISGGLATLSYVTAFNGLVYAQALPAPVASVCAYFVGMVVSYLAHSMFTFSIHSHKASGVIKFTVQSCLGILLSYSIIAMSQGSNRISHFWASIAVAVVIPLANYFLMKYWTFRGDGRAGR
ncbi:MAG: GtrA family protein [Nitratireductor sp.]